MEEGFTAENEAVNSEEKWFAEESDEFVSDDMAELFDDGDASTSDSTEEPGEDGENKTQNVRKTGIMKSQM